MRKTKKYLHAYVTFLKEGEPAAYVNRRNGMICHTSDVVRILPSDGVAETVFETKNTIYYLRNSAEIKLVGVPLTNCSLHMIEQINGFTYDRTTSPVLGFDKDYTGYWIIDTEYSRYEIPGTEALT